MRPLMFVLLLVFACDDAPDPAGALAPGSEPIAVTVPEASEVEPEAEAPAEAPPEVARPYEEGIDAQQQIDAALANAAGKRVLLVFGANWCPWCRRLEHTFRNEASVSARLESHFEVVHVDVGPRESDTNRDVARRYGDPLPNGLPCLVVLDSEGAVAHVQETGSLEQGDRHDPAKVRAFLERWASRS